MRSASVIFTICTIILTRSVRSSCFFCVSTIKVRLCTFWEVPCTEPSAWSPSSDSRAVSPIIFVFVPLSNSKRKSSRFHCFIFTVPCWEAFIHFVLFSSSSMSCVSSFAKSSTRQFFHLQWQINKAVHARNSCSAYHFQEAPLSDSEFSQRYT